MNSRPFFVLTCCLCVVALAMSLYVWQLRKNAGDESAPTATPEIVTTPSNATQKQIVLWVAHDDGGTLRRQSLTIAVSSEPQRQAEDILRALLGLYTAKNSPHPLPVRAAVRNVYVVDPGLMVIDLNSELATGQTSGVFAEELTVASIAQTLNANMPGLSRVKFLVDGKEASTLAGHADLSNIYDIAQFSAFAQRLSSQ